MSLTVHDKLALVTVADDVRWEEIAGRSEVGRHVLCELSPRAVVVEPAAVPALIAWLERAGYLPKVIE